MSSSSESESESDSVPQPPPLPSLKVHDNASSHVHGFNTARPTFEPVRLHFAINKEDLEAARDQVERGVDINFVVHGNPPLFLACLRRQFDIATMLVEAEANVSMGEVYPWARQPIHLAAMWGENELLSALLDHGASLQAADGMLMTPLHWAASYGAVDTVNLLLDIGAHLESKDDRGKTPLHRAAGCNHIGIVKALREAGSGINTQDVFGWTPLHQAVFCSLPVTSTLLQLGANPNIRDNRGYTPIHLMLLRHDYDHLRMLAKSDLQFYTRDRKITSSCTMGVNEFLCDPDILNLLLDCGLEINTRCPLGTTMQLAIRTSQTQMIDWLIQAGADVPTIPDHEQPMFSLLQKHKHLRNLKEHCKLIIRRHLYPPLGANINQLPLPSSLKEFLQIKIQQTSQH